MAKPTKLPEWALVQSNDPVTGKSNIVEPTGGEKNSGFTYNEKPTRQTFNWLFKIIYDWIKWVDDNIGQALNTDSLVQFDTVSATTGNFGAANADSINADYADIADIESETLNASTSVSTPTVSASTSINTPLVTATTKVNTPLIEITSNEGRTKRINEGVFGTKQLMSATITSTGKIATLSENKISVNLGTPSNDNAEFKIKYAGKYRIDFSSIVSKGGAGDVSVIIDLYKNDVLAYASPLSFLGFNVASPTTFNVSKNLIIDLAADDFVYLQATLFSNGTGVLSLLKIIFNIEMIGD